MTNNTLFPVAPPPGGGATSTQAGKPAQDAQTGGDFLAALIAQFQSTTGSPGGPADGSKTPGASQDALDADRNRPSRSGRNNQDLSAFSDPGANSITNLLAWVKANAGKAAAAAQAAQDADASAATGSGAVPVKKTTGDPASSLPAVAIDPSAQGSFPDPNAVVIVPIVPIALDATSSAPAADAANGSNVQIGTQVVPLLNGSAVIRPVFAGAVGGPAAGPAGDGSTGATSGSDAPAPAHAGAAVQAQAPLTPPGSLGSTTPSTVLDAATRKDGSPAPDGHDPSGGTQLAASTLSDKNAPEIKANGRPKAAPSNKAANGAITAEESQRLASTPVASDRPAAATSQASRYADERATALAALRAAVSANSSDADTAAPSGKDGRIAVATDSATSGQAGTGQHDTQSDRAFDTAPGLANLTATPAADSQLHGARILEGIQAAVPAGAHIGGPLGTAPSAHVAASVNDVPDAELSRQMVQGMRLQWRDGVGDAKITLQPDYLGGVSVSLRVADGGVTATLHADSPAVRAWIESNEGGLRQALADQGLTLHRLTVTDDSASHPLNPDGKNPNAQQEQRQQQRQQHQRQKQNGRTFESLM